MPPTCQTCLRSDVDAINEQLIQGVSLRNIAASKEGLHFSALFRHKRCIDKLFAENRDDTRAGLLRDVNAAERRIAYLEGTFPEDHPSQVQLVQRRVAVMDLKAKLTGSFYDPAANPADMDALGESMAKHLVKLNQFDTIEEAREYLVRFEAEVSEAGVIG